MLSVGPDELDGNGPMDGPREPTTMATGASPPGGPLLLQLRWPELRPVDLRLECPWLILRDDRAARGDDSVAVGAVDPESHDRAAEEDNHPLPPPQDALSPYRQRLCAPHHRPAPLSPAQRAAKRILRLQQELELLEPAGPMPAPTAHANPRSTRANKGDFRQVSSRSSPSKPLSEARHKRRRSPDGRETRSRDKLATWLERDRHRHPLGPQADLVEYSVELETRIQAAMNHSTGQGLWGDPVASLIAAEMTSETVFGGFVPTRRLRFEPHGPIEECKNPIHPRESSDVDVSHNLRSSKAAATHTLDVEIPITRSDVVAASNPESEHEAPVTLVDVGNFMQQHSRACTLVEEYAEEVRDEARYLTSDGRVDDALQKLQEGIHRVLYGFQDNQEEIVANGFNYSTLAHQMATRLQLAYKARHRYRVTSLLHLQRAWRRHYAHKRHRDSHHYAASNAAIIQTKYKQIYHDRRRRCGAVRIQQCYRTYKEQKHLILLHQACRMLNAQERGKRGRLLFIKARKRRLWAKLKGVLKLIWLRKIRLRSITCMQKFWRGRMARKSFEVVQDHQRHLEHLRRKIEDEFVAPRLELALQEYMKYLKHTMQGRNQCMWVLLKPWCRWRRNRQKWRGLSLDHRLQAIRELFYCEQPLKGLERRAIWAILTKNAGEVINCNGGYVSWPPVTWELNVPSVLLSLTPRTLPQYTDALTAKLTKMQRIRHRSRVFFNTVVHRLHQFAGVCWCFVLVLIWHVFFFPRRFLSSTLSNWNYARIELRRDQERVLRGFLRHMFRQLYPESKPRYACDYCGEGFATSVEYYAHRNGLCGERFSFLQNELQEIHRDLEYLSWNAWWRRIARLPVPSAPIRLLTSPYSLEDQTLRNTLKSPLVKSSTNQLISVARCCGLPSSQSLVNKELVAFLLHQCDLSLHPLARNHILRAVTMNWTATSTPPTSWIQLCDLQTQLGLRASTMKMSRHLLTHFLEWMIHQGQSTWMRLRRQSAHSGRYNAGTASDARVIPVID